VREITIFSGSAHKELAQEVCKFLDVPLCKSTFRHFSNDWLYVQLTANCREGDVFLIQPLVPPVQENLMELLLMLDAARGASAARTTAVIPYYAYARSDKKDEPRISIAGRLVADLLTTAGGNRLLISSFCSPQGQSFFSRATNHLRSVNEWWGYCPTHSLGNTVCVYQILEHAT